MSDFAHPWPGPACFYGRAAAAARGRGTAGSCCLCRCSCRSLALLALQGEHLGGRDWDPGRWCRHREGRAGKSWDRPGPGPSVVVNGCDDSILLIHEATMQLLQLPAKGLQRTLGPPISAVPQVSLPSPPLQGLTANRVGQTLPHLASYNHTRNQGRPEPRPGHFMVLKIGPDTVHLSTLPTARLAPFPLYSLH